MLELLQGVAQGREVSLVSAFLETVFQDSIKAIPIAVIWSLLWFVLLFLRALTSKKRGGGRAEPSVQDAARTLGGMNSGATSWFGLGLSMLEELLRMVSFLALPGIAWKGLGPIQSLREAFGIIRKDPMIFLSAYTLTGVAATIMAIPIIILFSVTDEKTIFPASVWTGVIIYEGMIWVLSLYLEQMTLALLYINNDPELFPQNNIELNAITNRMVGDIKTHEDKLKGGGESILHTPKNETKISSTLASVITWGLILLIIFMAVIYFSFFG